jgi:hypothetical protein
VRPARPFRKDDDVARLQLLLALRAPDDRRTGDDDQPLLATLLVVIRPRALSRRKLVETRAQQSAAEAFADSRSQMAETVAVVLCVPRVLVEQVEGVDSLMLRKLLACSQACLSADCSDLTMRTTPPRFRELDALVLHLKGLVLVRDLRRRDDADVRELAMYNDEIRRVREQLARLVKDGTAA